MAGWIDRKRDLEALAHAIDPAIRLRRKQDSWLMRTYARLPWVRDGFMDLVATHFGPIVWLPDGGDTEKMIHHEGRHVQQMRICGLGIHPWVGLWLYNALMVFVLPFFFTCRFWFELDAEAHALAYKYSTGSKANFICYELEEFGATLAGPDYRYAWLPKSWARKIARRRAVRIVMRGR